MNAASCGHTAIMKDLLFAGAGLSLKDKRGETARDLAEEQGHSAAVGLLDAWSVPTRVTEFECISPLRAPAVLDPPRAGGLAGVELREWSFGTK